MKLGIHLSTFTPQWSDDPLEFIPFAAQVGYEMVEIPLMMPDQFDCRRASELLGRYHLSCTCGTGMNPYEDISSLDASVREAGLKRLKKCVDIAAYLRSDCLGGVLYAPWGQRTPRTEHPERYTYSMECLRQAADYAAEKGVVLSLELLNRYESSFINNVDEGIAFLRQVERPNVKLHYDTFHAHIEESNQANAIEKGGKNIWHVHLCDNTRGAPGSGCVDFEAILTALMKAGYDRNLVVENFVIPNCESGTEACIWTKKWESPQQDAKEAFAYARRILNKVGCQYADKQAGV